MTNEKVVVMSQMLRFKSAELIDNQLRYVIEWQGEEHNLVYKIDGEHTDWLDACCADGAIVPFIYYAVRFGFDIE